MAAKQTSRAYSAAVHPGRPESVRQKGRNIWRRPNWTRVRRGRSRMVVEVGANGVFENNLVYTTALADSVTMHRAVLVIL